MARTERLTIDMGSSSVDKEIKALPGVDGNRQMYYNEKKHDTDGTYVSEMSSVQSKTTTFKGHLIISKSVQNDIFQSVDKTKKHAKTTMLCSCRMILSIVSCLGFMNLYTLRFNLSVAMAWMIDHEAVMRMESSTNQSSLRLASCISHADLSNLTSEMVEITNSIVATKINDGDFVWSRDVQNIIKSSFFWGYIATQLPGGWLAERYGGKLFLGWSIFGSAVCSLLMPMAARTDYRFVIVIRIISGVCQGVAWPAMFVMWSRWAPPRESQKLMTLTYSGSILGMVISFPAVAILCEDTHFGWPSVFYISGGLGILWTLAWYHLAFDSPLIHPRISLREKEYIRHSLKGKMSLSLKNKPTTPWKSLLTSRPVLAFGMVHTLTSFIIYSLIAHISILYNEVLGFSKSEAGLINSLTYIGFFLVSIISATLYDIFTARGTSRTLARKAGHAAGTFVPAIVIVAASFMDCDDKFVIVALIFVYTSLSGFTFGAGFLTNATDLAPPHVGVIFGLTNTMASINGILGPYLVTSMTRENLLSQWEAVFVLLATILALSGTLFIVFGTAKVQEWSQAPKDVDTIATPDDCVKIANRIYNYQRGLPAEEVSEMHIKDPYSGSQHIVELDYRQSSLRP